MNQRKRAIVTVSDKGGLELLGKGLEQLDFEIVSTGGTAAHLRDKAGVKVTDVSEVTGFPEMMHGRLKTLHPKIFGGLLARRDQPEDLKEASTNGIGLIDVGVINLYPFAQTVARPDCTPDMAIDNIDIGGPSLIRAAAKNRKWVYVVTDPAQYPELLLKLQQGSFDPAYALRLATEAFEMTAKYDAAIVAYHYTLLGKE